MVSLTPYLNLSQEITKSLWSQVLFLAPWIQEYFWDRKNGPPIPTISECDSFKLLQKLKPSVSDVDGLSVNHYKYAGPAGWQHFNLLLNSLICDVNNTDIEEINTAYAVILFKGHRKDRSSDKSYRLISSYPVVAKALDLHIRDAEIESWNQSCTE